MHLRMNKIAAKDSWNGRERRSMSQRKEFSSAPLRGMLSRDRAPAWRRWAHLRLVSKIKKQVHQITRGGADHPEISVGVPVLLSQRSHVMQGEVLGLAPLRLKRKTSRFRRGSIEQWGVQPHHARDGFRPSWAR